MSRDILSAVPFDRTRGVELVVVLDSMFKRSGIGVRRGVGYPSIWIGCRAGDMIYRGRIMGYIRLPVVGDIPTTF